MSTKEVVLRVTLEEFRKDPRAIFELSETKGKITVVDENGVDRFIISVSKGEKF